MAVRIRGWITWVGVLLMSVGFFIAGCSSRVEETPTKMRKQAFSVDDDLTPRTMSIALPPQASLRGSVLTAATSLELAAGAQVIGGGAGQQSLAVSLGGRPTELGTGAQLVGLVTRPGADLAARSVIRGGIITEGPITRESTSSIHGTVQEHAILDPLKMYSWSVAREAGSNVSVRADQVVTLAPGTFGLVTVASRGRLKLESGVYKFSSFFVKAGATVELPATGRVVTHIFDDWTSQGTWQSSNVENTLFVFYGDEVSLARGFVGTVVASNAQIEIGNGAFEGAFFGKEMLLASGARVRHIPFNGWDSVLPPKPYVSCVSQVGPGRFAALFGYESPLDHIVNISVGPSNSLTPSGPRAVSPVSIFSPGRQERALWGELVGGELTWSLGGQTARATPLSPGCSVEVAYPSQPLAQDPGERPSPPLSLKRKPPSYHFGSEVVAQPNLTSTIPPATIPGSPLLTAQPPSLQQATVPFTITITHVAFPRDTGAEINAIELDTFLLSSSSLPRRRLFTCDGCSYPPKAPLALGSLEESYSADVPASLAVLHVGFVLRDADDLSADDRLLFVDIDVDMATRKVIAGTVAGPNRDLRWPIPPEDINANCARDDNSALCWRIEASPRPQVSGITQICANWTASFVDEGFGESKQGLPMGSDGLKTYPARFAQYELRLDDGDPTIFFQPGQLDSEGCIPGGIASDLLVFSGAFKLNFRLDVLPNFVLFSNGNLSSDRIIYTIQRAAGAQAQAIPAGMSFEASAPGQAPFNQWNTVQDWWVPPQRIDLRSPNFTPITNVAATISTILTTPDNGIVAGEYLAIYGDGEHLKDANGVTTSIDSVFKNNTLFVGPATKPANAASCRTDTDCPGVQLCYEDGDLIRVSPMPCVGGSLSCSCMWPDQSRWKFVTTHEAGHQFQNRAEGPWSGSTYTFDTCPQGQDCSKAATSRLSGRAGQLIDPFLIDDRCGCQHVAAANGEHCLQSIERSRDAQGEGFAQFFASRVWNDSASPTCTFVYYKEFAQKGCLDGSTCTPKAALFPPPEDPNLVLQVHLPPVPIPCAPPPGRAWLKWRNSFCPMGNDVNMINAAEMGTERDWMGFLYAVNTGPNAITMTDLHMIYRHACKPPAPNQPPAAVPEPCSGEEPAWNEAGSVRGALEKAGFVQGVQRRFVGNDAVIDHIVLTLGDRFGVSENTQQ